MSQMRLYIVCLSLVLSLLSCDPTEGMTCQGSAKYKFTFQAEWTAQSHPEDFPSGDNPHFSPVVGCSHNSAYVMWKPGELASQGVKLVAESGLPGTMNNEIDAEITAKKALKRFNAGGTSNTGKTTTTSDIPVNTQYPLVSAITMIAPSPDWFLGVRDYNLCNETTGKWIDKTVKDLFLYDAGTDSAPRFVHTGTPTNPPVPIFLLTNTHEGSLKSNNTINRFGTFTFEKTSENIPDPGQENVTTTISTTPGGNRTTVAPSSHRNITTTGSGGKTTTTTKSPTNSATLFTRQPNPATIFKMIFLIFLVTFYFM